MWVSSNIRECVLIGGVCLKAMVRVWVAVFGARSRHMLPSGSEGVTRWQQEGMCINSQECVLGRVCLSNMPPPLLQEHPLPGNPVASLPYPEPSPLPYTQAQAPPRAAPIRGQAPSQ